MAQISNYTLKCIGKICKNIFKNFLNWGEKAEFSELKGIQRFLQLLVTISEYVFLCMLLLIYKLLKCQVKIA